MGAALLSDRKLLAKWIAIIFVPIAIWLIPTNETFTADVRMFFVVTLFGILTFVLTPFDAAIGSLLMMAFYVISGVADLGTIFSPFTQNVPWMVFGCLLLMNIIQSQTKLIDRITCLCLIITGGTYNGIIYGMIILGIVINIVVPGVFTCMAIWVLAYGICQELNLGKTKASSGIMLAAVVGFVDAWWFIYCPADFGVMVGIVNQVVPVTMDYFTFFINELPAVVFPFIMGFVITKICKPEVEINGKAYFQERRKKLGKLTGNEKRVIVVLVLLVAYLFTFQWHGQDMLWGFLFAPLLMYLPGMPGTKKDLQTVDFPTILFVVGCMSIGSAAMAVGVPQLISEMALPLLEGRSNTFFILFVYVFVVIFNFVMTPMALMSSFSAPLCQIATDLGMSPLPMLFAFSRGCYNILLPYEAVIIAVAVAYGNVRYDSFMKVFGAKIVLTGIFLVCVMCPYWHFRGLM